MKYLQPFHCCYCDVLTPIKLSPLQIEGLEHYRCKRPPLLHNILYIVYLAKLKIKRQRLEIENSNDIPFLLEQIMGLEPTTSTLARSRSNQLSYICDHFIVVTKNV